MTAYNGVATFSGLTMTTAASGYTFVVSGGGLGEGITSAINVTPAAASQVVITTEPPATVKLSSPFSIQASIEDAYGNLVTTATNIISVALAANPTGAVLGGTLSASANGGVAAFANLTINKVGNGYTLQLSSASLTGATTTAIDVTKNGKSAIIVAAPVTSASNALLGPMSFDSTDLSDGLEIKKRPRPI